MTRVPALFPNSVTHLAGWIVLWIAVGVLVGSAVGCVPQEAVEQAEIEVHVHRGVLRHASTAPLSSAQWLAAYQASTRAWEAQHRALKGTE